MKSKKIRLNVKLKLKGKGDKYVIVKYQMFSVNR